MWYSHGSSYEDPCILGWMPNGYLDRYQCFTEMCCPYLQNGRLLFSIASQKTAVLNNNWCTYVCCFWWSSSCSVLHKTVIFVFWICWLTVGFIGWIDAQQVLCVRSRNYYIFFSSGSSDGFLAVASPVSFLQSLLCFATMWQFFILSN